MTTGSPQLEDLLAQRPWDAYAGARIGVIGYRSEAGLVNLGASVIFEAEASPEPEVTVNVGSFVLHVGHYASAQVEEALRGLTRAEAALVLPWASVMLVPDKGARGWGSIGPDRDSRHTLGWVSRALSWMGRGVGEIVSDQVFWAANQLFPGAQPRSFAGWDDVAAWAVPSRRAHVQPAIGPDLRSWVDIHLPTWVRLHNSTCSMTGALDIHVDARHRADEVSVVVRSCAHGQELARLQATDFAVNPDGGRYCASVQLQADTGPVTCELLLDGVLLERTQCGVPPSFVRLYSALDPSHDWVEKLLGKGKGKGKGKHPADQFELGIHTLLSLAGVPTGHFGILQPENFPDLVAWVPPGGFIAGEVTLKMPDLNKITQLQHRILSMREALADAVPTASIWPVLFFNQTSIEVPEEVRRAAERDQIALVSQEGIESLAAAVLDGTVDSGVGILELLWR